MKGLKMKAQIQSVEYVTVLFAVKSTELIMSKDKVTPTSAQGSLKKKKKKRSSEDVYRDTFFPEGGGNICLIQISKSVACQLILIN